MRNLIALTLVALAPAMSLRAADWVTVKGRIVWDDTKGAPPARAPIQATKDQQVCAKDKDFNTEDWIVNAKTKGIKNVVVWLAPELGPAEQQAIQSKKLREVPSFKAADIHPDLAKPAKPAVEMDQPCCRFIPHIVLAREGQDMLIKNSAPVPHNAKWVSRNNGEINPLIPAGGQHVVNALKAERFPISVECSIHPWMKAYVRVFDHPYFALTDDDGNFEIKNAPVMAGKLRLFIWQETGGFQGGNDGRFGQTLDVKAGTVDLKDIKYAGKQSSMVSPLAAVRSGRPPGERWSARGGDMQRFSLAAFAIHLVAVPVLAQGQWSTVKGTVVFDDSKHKIPGRVLPPAAKGANLPPCAALDKEFLTEEWIVNPTNKGVKDAVVWLAPEPTADEWQRLRSKGTDRLRDFPSFKPEQLHPDLKALKAKTVEMDQPCCRFIPHQLAMRVGQTLVIKNSAAFPHNAKYDSVNNGSDNPLIPAGGKIAIPIQKPERSEIKILCNIHPWMWASVRVFDHPYFAVTNADGEYTIENAPVGKYRIFVWHSTGAYSGKVDGRFGYELTITPRATQVKPYSVTPDDVPKK